MVTPGGVADVESGGLELLEELTDDAESTSSGEGLDRGDSGVTNEGTVPSEEDSLGTLSELGETVNGEVLLVEGSIIDNSLLGLAHDGEDVGLSVVITVGTDTEVDLLGVLVGLEASGEAKDGVGGGHWNVLELVVQGGDSLHVV